MFSYRGRRIYDGLSLKLNDGAVYGLLGRNGAGKTTLMRLMAGLLKCTGGRISVNGMTPFERRTEFLDEVCFVPESFNAPDMPVVKFADSYGVFYSHYDSGALRGYLEAFDVNPGDSFRKLSAGQKKKALIAFALSLNTRLLLLDEPGNGLDIPSRLCLRRMLAGHRRPDRTIVLSTHQVREVDEITDHVTVIDSGRLLLNASLEEIAARVHFTRTGTPETGALYSEWTAAGAVNIMPGAVSRTEPPELWAEDKAHHFISDQAAETESYRSGSGVDLEVLFNACISGGRKVLEYLRSDILREKEVRDE